MKTIADITKELNKVYDGPTKEKGDFTYIPWNESVKAANEVFGIDGYDIEVLDIHLEKIPNIKGEWGFGYVARVRVTAYTSDGRPFHRDGVGFNDIEFTKEKSGKNKYGEDYYFPSRAQMDTATKGAASDALNRALKLFGPRFGLALYDNNKSGSASGSSSQRSDTASRPQAARNQSEDSGEEPTPKQVEWLVKLGLATSEEDAIERYTKNSATPVLDEAFKNKNKKGAAPAAKPAPKKAPAMSAGDDVDDLDAFFN